MLPRLDLSTMVARLILALLVTASVVLLGLWLREGQALGFAATLVSVSLTWYLTTALRGQRLGEPTAAAKRLQPLVDALEEYPGGSLLTTPLFTRGAKAVGVGVVVAIAEHWVTGTLLAGLGLPPLWAGLVALGLVLTPLHLALEWVVSKQEYSGTRFAGTMLAAIWKVVKPEATGTPWEGTSLRTRILGFGIARTVFTLGMRVVAQVLLPMLFATWVSIAFVAVALVTLIAGGPVFISLGASLKRATIAQRPTDKHDTHDASDQKADADTKEKN